MSAALPYGSLDQLVVEGPFSTPQAQATLQRELSQQMATLALRALKRVLDAQRTELSFASIRQGAQELYISFITLTNSYFSPNRIACGHGIIVDAVGG